MFYKTAGNQSGRVGPAVETKKQWTAVIAQQNTSEQMIADNSCKILRERENGRRRVRTNRSPPYTRASPHRIRTLSRRSTCQTAGEHWNYRANWLPTRN